MSHKIIEDIKKNKKEDWACLAKEKWTDTRIWLQEHGEWAFGIGIVTGAIIVLAFEIVIALVVVAFLLGFGVWYFADSNESQPATANNQNQTTSTLANEASSPGGEFGSESTSGSTNSLNGTSSSTNDEEDKESLS